MNARRTDAGVVRGLICLAVVCCVSVGAGEIRVPQDYPSLTEALAQAGAGDIIRVQSGAYSVDTGERFPLRITWPVTLIGDAAAKPHLLGDGAHTVVSIETGGVTLQGFSITGGMGSEGVNRMDGGGICVFVGATETAPVVIEDCDIAGNGCPSDETYDGSGGGIYCGGTYCTCFQTNIRNCVIRDNIINGVGGGVCGALLSNVVIEDSQILDNSADDQGGGVFVDVYAELRIANTTLSGNQCPGDSNRAGWGGRGGALACESNGLFSIVDSEVIENEAAHYGGGIFTGSSLAMDENPCSGGLIASEIVNCRIEKNYAISSGGGVYVAGYGLLDVSGSVFYWNAAGHNGGGIYIADDADVRVVDGSLLEGNECGSHGGGMYLAAYGACTVASSDLLGNTSVRGGGGAYLADHGLLSMTNCLMAYNNSARGWGAGIRGAGVSDANLVHCSIVGNFAPNGRSGLHLDGGTTATIRDSILWHNAGGSVTSADGLATITSSFNEDDDPNLGPGYVGWGDLRFVHVDQSAPDEGTGTPEHPYRDLQEALNGFGFRLGSNSPCLGAASDDGNLGADTGTGAMAGNILAALTLGEGQFDIRGRNLCLVSGILGSGADSTTITNAVLGVMNETGLWRLSVAGESGGFGGVTVRNDVDFTDCDIHNNQAAVDGAGIYMAEGDCLLQSSKVRSNTCWDGDGGGVYLAQRTSLRLALSYVEDNRTYGLRGGGIYAGVDTNTSLTHSGVSANRCGKYGGGLFLNSGTVCQVTDSNVVSNLSCQGGGFYVLGELDVEKSNIEGNSATVAAGSTRRGGGLFVGSGANVSITDATIARNRATAQGGGVMCFGGTTLIEDTELNANRANDGGGLNTRVSNVLCKRCLFKANTGDDDGGGVDIWRNNITPSFIDCNFVENVGRDGGAAFCLENTKATFDGCFFKDNRSSVTHGGSLYLRGSQTTIQDCHFQGGSSAMSGGAAFMDRNDRSVFDNCIVEGSAAQAYGGAFCLTDTATTAFRNIDIAGCQAANAGGGLSVHSSAQPTFIDVVVEDCQAVYGGGIYACGTSETILQTCSFLNNRAYELTFSADGGGAYLTEDARGIFEGCGFQGNTAQDDGGGMAVAENAGVDLKSTRFVANASVNDGGGIHFTGQGIGTLVNCTLVFNESVQGGTGGGVYLEADNTVQLDSSILGYNSPDGIRLEATPTIQYSCTQKMWPGTGNSTEDPLVDPGTFVPMEDSPCIDAGNPDPGMNDACLPPGQRTERNDMGITGGPNNCYWSQ